MFRKKEWIAMLLAGGQGSRLYTLTKNLAKPAVPFGGKYRIIDFPLSNCVNSGIDTVGVLTQYQPLILNEYIGNGQPWDLDRVNGGVFVLPPYQKSSGSDWYTGTANAIYQNINFIDRYDPEYVLILSGDHIYKMDYEKMLAYHKEKNADCTIAALQVPMEEASRFGIMNTYPDGSIFEFEEKPAQPKSNLASMGIYIFSWDKMRKYLIEDEADPLSGKDFGKNILPAMLANGEKMVAYPFEGYWKDVGTIDSLWEANMDLLDPRVPLDLYDDSWKIYSRNPVMPPHYVANDADVQNSMVTEGCTIEGDIDFSVIFSGVTVEKGAVVHDSIVMPNTVIKAGAKVEYAIIAENCVIGEGASIGQRPEDATDKDAWGVAVVGNNITVGPGAVVPPKAMIDKDVEGVR
ncbi:MULTISPECIES: glucose-1-phosphate adenylyltransferase [Anaerotruncus]|jgi:glucose-1-phosphate adenylyltransferase|uniref:glucose-1-phosphate adenylyltransferase n=1 Tax=Anaerotruncus TaxID=244127 RepID=UPI00082C5329|nr:MULTISPECIES: glucose-1-phosphate adenylyltransferase [Anaerotruncus]RGX52709.1 glucose-1-phosphate adenylyltransferase [Anaerotruncus sp. AF02-27]